MYVKATDKNLSQQATPFQQTAKRTFAACHHGRHSSAEKGLPVVDDDDGGCISKRPTPPNLADDRQTDCQGQHA